MEWIESEIKFYGIHPDNGIKGEGTENNPYKIEDIKQLQSIRVEPSANYKLVDNIDAEITNQKYLRKSKGLLFEPIEPFTGVFDGNGHYIKDLFIKKHSPRGLFSNLKGTVKNLGLVDLKIKGTEKQVGGIAGKLKGGHISRCYVHGNIRGGCDVGSIVGLSYDSLIEDCYSMSQLKKGSKVGGIVGLLNSSEIYNCFSNSGLNGHRDIGPLIGSQVNSEYSNIYWNQERTVSARKMPKWVNKHGSQLSVDEMKGKDAEIHMEGFDFNDIWVKDDKSYPQLKSNKRPKL